MGSPLVSEKPGGRKQRQSWPSTAKRRILLAARYISGLPALEVVNPHFMAQAAYEIIYKLKRSKITICLSNFYRYRYMLLKKY